MTDQNTTAFKEVAIIRHPRLGEYAFGFITSSVTLQVCCNILFIKMFGLDLEEADLVCMLDCFVPSSTLLSCFLLSFRIR